MRVQVSKAGYSEVQMDGELILGVKENKYGGIVKNQLKINYSEHAIEHFNFLLFDESVSLLINGDRAQDFYYMAKDEVGYIFQS